MRDIVEVALEKELDTIRQPQASLVLYPWFDLIKNQASYSVHPTSAADQSKTTLFFHCSKSNQKQFV